MYRKMDPAGPKMTLRVGLISRPAQWPIVPLPSQATPHPHPAQGVHLLQCRGRGTPVWSLVPNVRVASTAPCYVCFRQVSGDTTAGHRPLDRISGHIGRSLARHRVTEDGKPEEPLPPQSGPWLKGDLLP